MSEEIPVPEGHTIDDIDFTDPRIVAGLCRAYALLRQWAEEDAADEEVPQAA